jgi:hypothetical protein
MCSAPVRRNIPDEKYLEDLRVVACRLGTGTLTMRAYSGHGGLYHPSSFVRRFATWSSALARAGLAVVHFNSGVGADAALQDLKRVAGRLGRATLTQAEYRRHGTWGREPFIRHFGSWMGALEAAGLQPSRTWNVSEEDLFRNLDHLWRTLGRQPHYGELAKPFSAYVAGTYEYRFGTWRKALEDFRTFMDAPAGDLTTADIGSPTGTCLMAARRATPWTIDWRLRFQVMMRDGFHCVRCGTGPSTGQELLVDLAPGHDKAGDPRIDALQTCCRACRTATQPDAFVRFGTRSRPERAGRFTRRLPAPADPR